MTAPASASGPPRPLVVLGVLTVVVGFALGFGLAARRPATESAITTGTSAPPPATAAPATTEAAPTSETTAAPSTAAPTTATTTTTTTSVATTVVTTAPVTVAPVTTARPVVTTAPPVVTTAAPPRVLVTYPTDAFGRLLLPRAGTATLVITNSGGLASQWLVTGTGFRIVGAASQGTLGPGQSANVVIAPPSGDLPAREITGTVSVLGAINSSIPFATPPR